MIPIAAISGPALEYAKARLADGLSLSRRSIPQLANMTAVALVPMGASAERALDFKQGGLGRNDLAEIAALLARTYPGASLVVELPLWRPDDPGVSDSDSRNVISGSEVYATCQLSSSLQSIEKTLRLADPSFMYNAIIVQPEIEIEAGTSPADLIGTESATIRAVLIGAYDGEGFIIASVRPLSSVVWGGQ